MAIDVSRSRLEVIDSFFRQRRVYHGICWLLYILINTLVEVSETNFWFALGNHVIRTAFYMVAVYFNLLYLIPNYLSPKKFPYYSLWLLGAVVIATSLQIFTLYCYYYNCPACRQTLLEHQEALYLLTFLIVGASTIIRIIIDWIKHQRERQELEKQTMQSELRFLKSQINPHFLFNTLNNLYALTLKKSDKAPEIVIKLSEMMRYMLYECNEKQVPLSKEVNYIHNYLDLERLRQGRRVDIGFEVKGAVKSQQVAPLLFIHFIENSFKHGLSRQIAHGFVDIVIEVNIDYLRFIVKNSKPPVSARDHHRSGGIGLVNVKRRLALLYPNKHELRIENEPEVYSIELELELN